MPGRDSPRIQTALNREHEALSVRVGEESADAKWTMMLQEQQVRLRPKREARAAVLSILANIAREAEGTRVGDACTVSQLFQVCAAIEECDPSLHAPGNPKLRRAFVSGWYEDNRGMSSCDAPSDLTRLVFTRHLSSCQIKHERETEARLVEDYHVRRRRATAGGSVVDASGGATLEVIANRTHAFCRPGFHYLLQKGEAWAEVKVTAPLEASGEHAGIASVAAVSAAGPAVLAEEQQVDGQGGQADGDCWCFVVAHS